MAPPYAPAVAFRDQYTSVLDTTPPAPQRIRSNSSPLKSNPLQSTPSALSNWESTLEKSIKSIVSIQASHTRAFDTDVADSFTATGFIVDAKQGLILTNRHVVSPGPIVASAILTNYEEIDLKPIYRDPVHDFGFMQFDPSKVKFMELQEIPLSPERAKVGLDIRVVGNDAGEKLSILAGTLARLDRRAPEYGVGGYQDFNTFYLQAASGTSGGSSGSPVLDIYGHAVALNAGGATSASSSYYLPLDRVKRALNYIQQGMTVPRGTLQAEFEYLPYDEIRRLGLGSSIEQMVRTIYPTETGMLVVKSRLPRGPADGKLVPGDILLRVNNEMVVNFNQLFGVIDESVGQAISMSVARGSNVLQLDLTVQDLHSITPNRYLEIGASVLNELSYQIARSYSLPVGGVYVASAGHMFATAFVHRKSIIVSVNNEATPTLDDFIRVIQTLPDGAIVPIRFYSLAASLKDKVMVIHVDRHWHPCRKATRNDITGEWDYVELPQPTAKLTVTPSTATFPPLDPSLKLAQQLMPSFVAIDFHMPYLVDGMKSTQYYGCGLIVSLDPPLIICDRDTVPVAIGDIHLCFANSISIPGKLVFLHPFSNYAVLSFDPRLLGNTPIQAAKLSSERLSPGDQVNFVGLAGDNSAILKRTTVSSLSNMATRESQPPRYRAMNTEAVKLSDAIGCQGGVVTDDDGIVQALWMTINTFAEGRCVQFMAGLSSSTFKPVIDMLISGAQIGVRSIDVEFWTMGIANARTLGVTDEWVSRIEQSGRVRQNLLYVLGILDSSSPVAKVLKAGDVIVQINDKIVIGMSDIADLGDAESVEMVIFRDTQEMTVQVPTMLYSGQETTRIIKWQGTIIQEPYKAVLEQMPEVPTGVYVSCTLHGSPSSDKIHPGSWITEFNGRRIHDMDSFLEAVSDEELKNEGMEGYARIQTIQRGNVIKVVAFKMDPLYWPTRVARIRQ
ncbi:trypsin-like cysteine/serine peptidase domain-containing protein [Umbelopsis sp. PMI_123]|nr:trypsin-like cysteine/serine peptidase domain-containing protein [Umbelopsis sp. PMI_123]